ncbi:MAG: glycosyltransferase [Hyphomicrobiaceae bacterium]|nr:glycosyltransferase [Hyphomicrobiaceae bacterium]
MLIIDWTHMSRRASGIERITAELFSAEALAPLAVRTVGGGGKLSMIVRQQALIPTLLLANPRSLAVFPGYPPALPISLMRGRSVLYVHDLFLMTRRQDLNRAGRVYLAPQFSAAVRRLRYFLTNSETTARELAQHTRADAEIRTYRPRVRNVFALSRAPEPPARRDTVIVGTIGTIEPRKNLLAAAGIVEALAERLGQRVELHVLGRRGWGADAEALARLPHVRLLGFLPDAEARAAIAGFDLYLSTSHDEGLGLPLLEAQYGGVPVIAPDKPVFREVLGRSGTFIDPARPNAAADAIAALLSEPEWRQRAAALAAENIVRWNDAAARDHHDAIAFFRGRLEAMGRGGEVAP